MKNELTQTQPFLKQLAYSYTNNVTDAQDLVQETILRAISKYHLFTPGTSFKNWTATIMRNIFINEYRRKKRWKTVDISKIPTASVTTNNLGESFLVKSELNKIKARLKSDQKEILDLLSKGYKYHEVANILDIPLGTVKSKVHFARKALKRDYSRLMNISISHRA